LFPPTAGKPKLGMVSPAGLDKKGHSGVIAQIALLFLIF
jgi:hypothetical protein